MQVVEPRLEQAAEVVEPRREQAAEVVERRLEQAAEEGGPGCQADCAGDACRDNP